MLSETGERKRALAVKNTAVFSGILLFVLTFTLSLSMPLYAIQGDLDGDKTVDFADLAEFTLQWLGEASGSANLDDDSDIDYADFALLAQNWLNSALTVVINEFMASNNNTIEDPEELGEFPDWIEIYNASSKTVELGGMYLTDDNNEPTKWRIPDGINVESYDYIIFWADDDDEQGDKHTNFKLDADGEEIGLFDTNGSTLIDGVVFEQQYPDISFGRYLDGSGNWRFMGYPTPDANNDSGYLGKVADTRFSVNRGFYENPFQVRIACDTQDVQIRYTLDGKDPVEPNGTIYDSNFPIQITQTTCLRAAAYKPGWLESNFDTQTYILNADNAVKSLPVFSIVGDAEQSLYEPNGVMAIVGGYYSGGVWQSDGPDSYNNPMQRGMAYERPISLELINSEDNSGFGHNCGIRVHGSDYIRPRYTRGDDWTGCWNTNKISFKVYFRNIYGPDMLDYDLLPLTSVDSFKRLVIRGGHNDSCNPFIKDEMIRRLQMDMGHFASIGLMANLFLNGEYKCFYNPCERVDEDFCQQWYQSDEDWDVITTGEVQDGDAVVWNALLDYARNNDLSISANYQQVADGLDITEFIDYLILELYMGNWDWPNNNWIAAAERSEQSKFRFYIWDAEGSMEWGRINEVAFNQYPIWQPGGGMGINGEQTPIGWFYQALKPNHEFKMLFADRIQKHFYNDGALTADNLIMRFEQLRDDMLDVIPGMDTYILDTWIPQRQPIMFDAFVDEGMFTFQGPVFNINGSPQHGGHIAAGDNLTIESGSSGTIYYTLDGSDPRVPSHKSTIEQTTLIAEDAAKKVYIPTYDIGTTWQGGSEPYNDSAWTHGTYIPEKTGGVGYERGSGYEDYISYDVESEMYDEMPSCYIRIPFTVNEEDLAEYNFITLNVRCDDGFVAFLNGVEIASINKPDPFLWNSSCANRDDDTGFVEFDLTPFIDEFEDGSNILAIHAMNTSTTSSDFLISAELIAGVYSFIPASVSPDAVEYTVSITLSETKRVKSRILDGDQWSALCEAVFAVGPVADNLRITEIMYHPQDTNEPNDPNEEFVELKNTGAEAININLVRFTNGIDFTFGDISLDPAEYIIVVKDINAFVAEYGSGCNIAGQYTGSLANDGERIRLEDAVGTTILDFRYQDGWRSNTDGEGYSLTIINPDDPDPNSWSQKDSWRPSAYIGGSPCWDDSGITPNPSDVVISEVLAHSDVAPSDWIELHNTTGSSIDITNWFLSDDDANLTKYEIITTTEIPPYGYVVFTQDDHFGSAFALSENGEMVCLTSKKDANDNLTGYRQKEDFGASENGVAFGRYYKESTNNYNFVAMSENTPGAENAYPKVGPVVISEIMYHPEIFWSDWDSEYIELTNISDDAVNLYDANTGVPWKITDCIEFTFPPNTTIPPYSCILLVRDLDAFNTEFPGVPPAVQIFEWDSGRLDNDGEKVEISMAGDLDDFGVRQYIRIDRVNYSNGSHPEDFDGSDPWPTEADGQGYSLTRVNLNEYGNDPTNWQAAAPTPGE